MEPSDMVLDDFFIIDEGGFGDFNLQQMGIKAITFHETVDFLMEIGELQIMAGEIDRHRGEDSSRVPVGSQLPAYFLNHIEIQLVEEPAFLQRADKNRGRQQAPDGIVPAGQGFEGTDSPVQQADDGMIVNFDPSLLDGFIDMAGHIGLHDEPLSHFLIIPAEIGVTVFRNAVACHFGPPGGKARTDFFSREAVNACFHVAMNLGFLFHVVMDSPDNAFCRLVGDAEIELIRKGSCHGIRIGEERDGLAHFLQKPVSRGMAHGTVDDFEMAYIHEDHRHLPGFRVFPDFTDQGSDVIPECIDGEDPGQLVMGG